MNTETIEPISTQEVDHWSPGQYYQVADNLLDLLETGRSLEEIATAANIDIEVAQEMVHTVQQLCNEPLTEDDIPLPTNVWEANNREAKVQKALQYAIANKYSNIQIGCARHNGPTAQEISDGADITEFSEASWALFTVRYNQFLDFVEEMKDFDNPLEGIGF